MGVVFLVCIVKDVVFECVICVQFIQIEVVLWVDGFFLFGNVDVGSGVIFVLEFILFVCLVIKMWFVQFGLIYEVFGVNYWGEIFLFDVVVEFIGEEVLVVWIDFEVMGWVQQCNIEGLVVQVICEVNQNFEQVVKMFEQVCVMIQCFGNGVMMQVFDCVIGEFGSFKIISFGIVKMFKIGVKIQIFSSDVVLLFDEDICCMIGV